MNDPQSNSITSLPDDEINNSKNIFTILILIIITSFLLTWTLVKLIFIYICHKYKCKIKFQFNSLYQLKNINVIKLIGDNENATSKTISAIKENYIEVNINKLYISSCYLNRNVKDRLLICIHDVSINANLSMNKMKQMPSEKAPKQTETNYYYSTKLFNSIIILFFKYFASLCIENLSVRLNLNNRKRCVSFDTTQLEIKFKNILRDTKEYEKEDMIELKFFGLNLNYDILNDTRCKTISLAIKQTILNFILANDKKDKQNNQSITKFIDRIENIDLILSDVSILNKLDANELNDELNQLVDNSQVLNQCDKKFKLERKKKIIYILNLIKKFQLIKIKSLSYENDNGDEETSGDFVKLERFKLVCKEDAHKSVVFKNLDYFKQNRFNYSILNSFELTINDQNELMVKSNDSNMWIQIDLIDRLLNNYSRSLINLVLNGRGNSTTTSPIKFVSVKLENFYVSLVDDFAEKNRVVYTIGSNSLSVDYNKFKHYEFGLESEQFVIFKSTYGAREPFTNSLFDAKLNLNLADVFRNMTGEPNADKLKYKHFWGSLFQLDNFSFKYTDNKESKKLKLRIDQCALEYWPELFGNLVNRLNSLHNLILYKYENEKVYNSASSYANFSASSLRKPFSVKASIKSTNLFYLYKRKYLLNINASDSSLIKLVGKADKLNLSIDKLNCLQYSVEDIPLAKLSLNKQFSLDYSVIDHFKEDYESDNVPATHNKNYNLVFLIKSINSIKTRLTENAKASCVEYYVCVNDILFTWSLQMHYIFYETLVEPFNGLNNQTGKNLIILNKLKEYLGANGKLCLESEQSALTILIESNILVNFLFDYSQDSSKVVAGDARPIQTPLYFNATPPYLTSYLIHTVSIILNNAFFKSTSSRPSFKSLILDTDAYSLNINDVSLFINVDDQNINENETGETQSRTENQEDMLNSCSIMQSANKFRKFIYIKNFSLSSASPLNSPLVQERKMLNTKQELNRSATYKNDLFHVNFLFNYDFAKLFDHLLNLRKCLMLIHNKNKPQPNETSAQISSDLLISIKQFKLTIEDDPFEIKLAYNYALMMDEHSESTKRRQTLEQRRTIKEHNLEMEAFEMLREVESKVYYQRSKMVYNNSSENFDGKSAQRSIRTELFFFCIDNLEFFALADSEWHGRQKCYDILREIDSVSPPPPPASSISSIIVLNKPENFNPADHYTTLFCRHMNLKCDEFKLLFRDYTQPLLKMNKLNLFGKFLGAEYEPAHRAKRDIKLGVGNELPEISFSVQRSMSPFKIYYDLCSKMNLFSFAYGPCWEGCMAQLNLSLDKIIHPARDPSKPMPWWDKVRLYLHGRLTSVIQTSQTIYHVSMDPYNRTEEMKWVWSDLYFDWSNRSSLLYKGTLDIYLNTESKYDDIRLLHFPCLEMKINIDWLCKAQQQFNSLKKYSANNKELLSYNLANAHNYVMPCAPDKIPVIVNSCEHDSFSQFRSENVNVSISFVCKPDEASNNLPTCKFYASTSRFLQRIKNLLSAITRPTKRGSLFCNFKPRKPILSRHFKLLNIHLDIPKLSILYWSSANEEYGIQFELEHFLMNSMNKLELVPFIDKLKRRPRPGWSIEMMKINVSKTFIYLMSPSSSPSNQARPTSNINTQSNVNNQAEIDLLLLDQNERSIKLLETPAAMRNFFMQIDHIFYERIKNNCEYNFYNESLCENDTQAGKLNYSGSFKHKKEASNMNKNDKLNYSTHTLMVPMSTSRLSISGKGVLSKDQVLSESDAENENNPNKSGLLAASMTSLHPFHVSHQPKHNILVKNLKAKWNNVNWDVLYTLYEIYNKSKRLRHNISSQALKQYDMLTEQIIQNYVSNGSQLEQSFSTLLNGSSPYSTINSYKMPYQYAGKNVQPAKFSNQTNTLKNMFNNKTGSEHSDEQSQQQSKASFFEEFLRKLDAERGIKSEVYCDENQTIESSNYNSLLYGVHATTKMSDVINENVYIEFVNSQVKLSLEDYKSGEAKKQMKPSRQQSTINPNENGQNFNENAASPVWKSFYNNDYGDYLIISAAKTNVVQRIHKPLWKSQRLLEKTSWSGYLESMQYFATLNDTTTSAPDTSTQDSTIYSQHDEYWLSDNLIDESLSSPTKLSKSKLRAENKSSNNSLGMLISYHTEPSLKSDLPLEDNTSSQAPQPVKHKKSLRSGLPKKLRKNKPQSQDQIQINTNTNPPSENTEANYYNQRNLQLIVSKCKCEFYMIDFDDKIPNSDENDNDISSLKSSLSQTPQFYAQMNDESLNPNKTTNHNQIDLNASFNEPIDCFTLIHHDLNLCTNSKQYKMIMDTVNNLVLYFRPRRKQVTDKQKSIKFNLQLSMGNVDSLKQHIQQKQIEAKQLVCKLRLLERKLYHLREKIELEIKDYNYKYNMSLSQQQGALQLNSNQIYVIQELKLENKSMEKEYRECKKMLNELSDELNISISCYKEIMFEKRAFNLANTPQFVQHILSTTGLHPYQNYPSLNSYYKLKMDSYSNSLLNKSISMNMNNSSNKANEPIDLDQQAQQSILNNEIGRRYEIWFKHTQWKLNDDDGKTGMAKFLMKNFLYTKVTNQIELDCVEHSLEIESCKVQDLAGARANIKNTKSSFYDNVLTSLFDESASGLERRQSLNTNYEYGDDENSGDKNDFFNGDEDNDDVLNVTEDRLCSHLASDADDEETKSALDPNKSFLNRSKHEKEHDGLISSNTPNSRTVMFRIYCKERPPVGIPVIEHLELNISPLLINLTNRFYKMMLKFFFENNSSSPNGPISVGGSNQANGLVSLSNLNSVSSNANGVNSAENSNPNAKIPAVSANSTLQRSFSFQKHSYKLSVNEDINNIINSNLSTSSGNSNSMLTQASISPNIPSNQSNSTNNQLQPGSNSTPANSNTSSGLKHIPVKIQSPNTIKNMLHNKKPSQSSLLSNTNIIIANNSLTSTNSISLLQITGANLSQNSNNNQSSSQLTNSNLNININNNINSASNNPNANDQSNNQLQNEDIEIMKHRSANNNTFLCIKITEIQLLVSFKGGKDDKEKNLKDLNNVSLLFPLFEVHDQTWTWLDLINALKSHVKKALLSQALKHKLIKLPIQPVNKLINRKRNKNKNEQGNQLNLEKIKNEARKRSNSQGQVPNLEIDEKEKLTMLKLFGTKLLEKKASNSGSSDRIASIASNDFSDSENKKKFSLTSNFSLSTTNNSNNVSLNQITSKESKPKKLVTKSNSTLSFDLKKKFLAFAARNNLNGASNSSANKNNNE